ncbi:MAG: fibronectin type III domain-containing protein, partial [Blastocatellia bacterium]
RNLPRILAAVLPVTILLSLVPASIAIFTIADRVQTVNYLKVRDTPAIISRPVVGTQDPAGSAVAPVVTAAGSAESQVALIWSVAGGATSYNVYRGAARGSETLLQSGVLGTTFEDSNLADGATYYYQVTAVTGAGESGKSNEASAVTRPPGVIGFAAAAGDSHVDLQWSPSPTATSYRIYRDTLGGAGGAADFVVTGTSFTDSGLINGTTYYYAIAPINVSGENPGSSAETFATPNAVSSTEAPAGAAANLTTTAGNGRVYLNWSPVSNATAYDIFRNGTKVGSSAASNYSDFGLANGTPYFYQVRAVNAGQYGGFSSGSSATPHVPSAPGGLTAKAGSGQIALNWTADGTSYAIYRGTRPGSETLLNSGLTGNTFTDAGLTNGTPYFYKVQSLNAGGIGPLSAEVSATPAGPAPQPWSGTVSFALPGEPIQTCNASIPDVNRPVGAAFFIDTDDKPNILAVATKYNAISIKLGSFNFGTIAHPIYMGTTHDANHPLEIFDFRWPQPSAQRIKTVLANISMALSKHPEIQNTGLVFYGFSEGVDNVELTISQPTFANRVLAVIEESELDEARFSPLVTMDSVPHLFIASGKKDMYSSLNLGLEDYPTVTHDALARGLSTNQGAPHTTINNAGFGHGGNRDNLFISIWLDDVLSQRLPFAVSVKNNDPVVLPSWQNSSAWVGAYDWRWTWGGVRLIDAVIAAKTSYTDPRPFTWLPSQNTAKIWLTYAITGTL